LLLFVGGHRGGDWRQGDADSGVQCELHTPGFLGVLLGLSGDDDYQPGILGLVGNLARGCVCCGTRGFFVGERAERAVGGAGRGGRSSRGGSGNGGGGELTGLPVNRGVGCGSTGDCRSEGSGLADDNRGPHG
jgi:hypothetical protein